MVSKFVLHAWASSRVVLPHRNSDALGVPLSHSVDMKLCEDRVRGGTSEYSADDGVELHVCVARKCYLFTPPPGTGFYRGLYPKLNLESAALDTDLSVATVLGQAARLHKLLQ